MIEDLSRRVLGVTWWVILPPFMLLTARFAYERTCLDPYELLQPIMKSRAGALLVASVYVGAYVWVVAAGILTARAAARSTWAVAWRTGSGLELFKMLTMTGALAIEQVPRALWQWLHRC